MCMLCVYESSAKLPRRRGRWRAWSSLSHGTVDHRRPVYNMKCLIVFAPSVVSICVDKIPVPFVPWNYALISVQGQESKSRFPPKVLSLLSILSYSICWIMLDHFTSQNVVKHVPFKQRSKDSKINSARVAAKMVSTRSAWALDALTRLNRLLFDAVRHHATGAQ